jgi:hypothetical protein
MCGGSYNTQNQPDIQPICQPANELLTPKRHSPITLNTLYLCKRAFLAFTFTFGALLSGFVV